MSTPTPAQAPLGTTNAPPTVSEIRIYVACLAAYNSGCLHGRWTDATRGEEYIWSETRAMLKASPQPDAEEWVIHDYEGFEGASLSEYASFETVADMAEFIEEHGQLGGSLITHYGGELADAQTALEHYQGEHESLEDYARQFTEDCGPQIPDSLQNYFDYAAMARDWEMSGDIFTIETGFSEIHVFSSW